MNRAAFDRAVTDVLDAVTAAAVAEHLTAELDAAYRARGRSLPSGFLLDMRAALCPELEPGCDPQAARAATVAACKGLEAERPHRK
jgi:hypothetical protein